MKKTKRYKSVVGIFLACMLALMAGSCSKMPVNGKLDGQWQLMSIESEGVVQQPDERIYICFNLHVVNLTDLHNNVYAGNLHYADEKVSMDFPYMEDAWGRRELAKWGIYENPIVFEVKSLTNKQLILQSSENVITLRRF